MTPPARWPIHPALLDGEALSSWLHRTAAAYELTLPGLLEHDLGHHRITDAGLDSDPPPDLLESLSGRSGVEPDRLRRMSLAGLVPWLLDSLDPCSCSFETYTRQFSVLLPTDRRPSRTPPPGWRPWLPPGRPVQRACRRCLDDAVVPALLLTWNLPLQLSCPTHRCLLEPCECLPAVYVGWESDQDRPTPASDPVAAMDARTSQALRDGRVTLPRRQVHAGVWFRLLRTLLDELCAPLGRAGCRGTDLRQVWEQLGGRNMRLHRRPFEELTWPDQALLLEAAATAIGLIERGTILARGTHGSLLTPEPVSTSHRDLRRAPPRP
ncbi:TniQ family protein [Rhodococcus spelaei]|uniref:TniQ family protein n=1 Tax=Rhodococcus spelaei TaxID=2546320 RepID=UPI0015EF9D01|nr:TniQ family protein [Rhodococcus spelaei]